MPIDPHNQHQASLPDEEPYQPNPPGDDSVKITGPAEAHIESPPELIFTPACDHSPTSSWQPRVLILLLLFGLALRLAYVAQIDTPPFSDMADYETMALNLLEGKGLIMSELYKAYRPPAYPLLLAGVYRFFGLDPLNVYYLQCVMSILTVLLVYLMAFHLFNLPKDSDQASVLPRRISPEPRTIALWSAVLFCFEETSIFFCGQMLTETLFTLLFVGWGYLLIRQVTRPSLPMATWAGILAGIGILTRPNMAPLVLVGAFWFFRASRKYFSPPPADWHRFSLLDSPFAPPSVMVMYAFLVVSFWTVRNQAVLEHFIPVSTNSGVNFYLGHHEGFGYNSFGDKEGIRQRLRAQGSNDEVVESKIFTLIGLRYIRNNFWEDMQNNITKIYHLFLAPVSWSSAIEPWKWWSYLDSPYRPWPWETQQRELRFWPVKDESGRTVMPSYRDYFWKEGRLPLVFWGWPIIYLTLLGGIVALRRYPLSRFFLLILIAYTLVLMIYFANARFRAPLLPFLYPFTAYALCLVGARFRKFCKG